MWFQLVRQALPWFHPSRSYRRLWQSESVRTFTSVPSQLFTNHCVIVVTVTPKLFFVFAIYLQLVTPLDWGIRVEHIFVIECQGNTNKLRCNYGNASEVEPNDKQDEAHRLFPQRGWVFPDARLEIDSVRRRDSFFHGFGTLCWFTGGDRDSK